MAPSLSTNSHKDEYRNANANANIIKILAIIEYPDGWEGPRKFRLAYSNADTPEKEGKRWTMSRLKQSAIGVLSSQGFLLQNEDGVEMEYFDSTCRKFIPLENEDDGIFEKRAIHVRVSHSRHDGKDGSIFARKTPLMIKGRHIFYDTERGMDFSGGKLRVREIVNRGVENESGTGWNVWDGSLLL